jgi:hypothetical protein
VKLDRSTISKELLAAPDLTDAQMEVLKNTLSAMLIALAKAPKDAVIGDTTLLMSELMVFGMKAVLNGFYFDPKVTE